jgi:tRNA modification GTPase
MAANYLNEDTIAAIATSANVTAALGVIRVSGPQALEKSGKILRSLKEKKFFADKKLTSHKFYRALVVDKTSQALDDALVVYMKGPNSFTGEDVVELHLHGNPLLLKRVMQELLHIGVREAYRGEFSFRAFKNGKISLNQAESIADFIASETPEQSKRALNQLLGSAKSELEHLKNELVKRAAEIEVDIDFSDQGLSVLPYEEWKKDLISWCGNVEKIRQEFLQSQPLREGIQLALVGAPNSGKSSLFNRLLGEDRSIVSQEAGTTRDVVRESILMNGLTFRLSDTAGIRETENVIEAKGIDRSFGEVKNAHLVLWVIDGEIESKTTKEEAQKRYFELKKMASQAHFLGVWNKSDLSPAVSEVWKNLFLSIKQPLISVSAQTGQGLELLREEIQGLFKNKELSNHSFLIGRSRHFEVLGKAQEAVRMAIQKVDAGELFPDLLSSDLRSALNSLGEITGEFTTDDLLNHIFSEFCIGK